MRKRKQIYYKLIKIVSFVLIFCVFAYIIDSRIRPIVKMKVIDCARTDTTIILNNTLLEEIDKLNISYNDFAKIIRSEDNLITSIEINSIAVNSFKAMLATAITKAVEEIDEFEFSIAVGTLLGPEMFNETGPRIPFKVSSSKFVDTEIKSSFEEAGINQTIHRMLLCVKTNIACYFPGYFVTTDVEMKLTLAETVIIGDVPKFYSN